MLLLAVTAAALATEPSYLVGEFDPSQALLLASWPGDLNESFVPLVEASLAQGIPPVICERDPESGASARASLAAAGLEGALWADCAPRTIWMRDYAPLFLMTEGGEPRLGDARYRIGPTADDAVPGQLAEALRFPLVELPVTMEGGNLLPNGQGLCLTTEILNNGDLAGAADALAALTGCEALLALEPLAGEGTGHVDVFAAWAGPDTVLIGVTEDPLNAERLDRGAARLEAEGLEVRRVPMPAAQDFDADGFLDFPTALNALILTREGGGGAVTVPIYPGTDPSADDAALAAWADAMPEHDIVAVPADGLIVQGGALHCVTRAASVAQWPRPCEDPYAFNDGACAEAPTGRCATGPLRGPWGLALLAALGVLRRRSA